jgi:lysophospholipase L1-like esterase
MGRPDADLIGTRLVARVVAGEERRLAGRITLLAARGAATLTGVHLAPVPAETAGDAPLAEWSGDAGVLLALLVGAAAGLRLLGSLPVPRALELAAFALVPLAAGAVLLRDRQGGTLTVLERTTFAAAVLLLIPVLVRARWLTPGRFLLLVLLAFAAAPLAAFPLLAGERGVAAMLPSIFNYVSWSGERLDDDLMLLQHPVLRLMNDPLQRHRFRGREFALEKPPGTRRVITLGGSSTWGWGLIETEAREYPMALERLLDEQAPRDGTPRVEVLNAAYCGATGPRLFRWLRDGLAAFRPDVVTLSLGYNDAFALTRADEAALLASATDGSRPRSAWRDLQTVLAVQRGENDRQRLFAQFKEGKAPAPVLWSRLHGAGGAADDPPARFELVLRQFADLARERGFRLVLIKEPLGGDRRFPWKAEFHAAMDRVAADYGLAVVDPTPALQAAGGAELFLDEVHPRAAGHAIIARELEPAVRAALRR